MSKVHAYRLRDMVLSCGAAQAAVIRVSDCRSLRPHQLSRLEFKPKTAVIGLLPYYTPLCDDPRSVSVYALGYDYHYLLRQISEKIINAGKIRFPDWHFAVCGDISPFDEVDAAARAGLGIIGRNRLLITKEHSSFVFIFELLTDIDAADIPQATEPEHCENCGRCVSACPTCLRGKGECLSAITQKKGVLTPDEEELMRKYGTIWGCDRCQLACPHTVAARRAGTLYRGSEWFLQNALPFPTEETISDPDDFPRRAYSWRGIDVMRRNLHILEGREDNECQSPNSELKEEKLMPDPKKND